MSKKHVVEPIDSNERLPLTVSPCQFRGHEGLPVFPDIEESEVLQGSGFREGNGSEGSFDVGSHQDGEKGLQEGEIKGCDQHVVRNGDELIVTQFRSPVGFL